MPTARVQEITEAMLELFEEESIEDTPENRLAGLLGLQEAWNEDEDSSIEKTLYQLALSGEIFRLKLELMFNPFD